jgi:hypothetical protein
VVGVVLLSFMPAVGMWFCVSGALIICFAVGFHMLNTETDTQDVM